MMQVQGYTWLTLSHVRVPFKAEDFRRDNERERPPLCLIPQNYYWRGTQGPCRPEMVVLARLVGLGLLSWISSDNHNHKLKSKNTTWSTFVCRSTESVPFPVDCCG